MAWQHIRKSFFRVANVRKLLAANNPIDSDETR